MNFQCFNLGIITDLARSPHSLDLSSQDLVATINVMLKPLEKLTNLANSQTTQQPQKNAGKDKDTGISESTASGNDTFTISNSNAGMRLSDSC